MRSGEQGDSLVLSPRGGAGSFGVAYGVLISVETLEGDGVTDAASLSQATRQIVQRLMQQSRLTQSGNPVQFQLGDQPAFATDFRGASPVVDRGAAQVEHDWLVTIARSDGDIDVLTFVSPEADFRTLKPVFDSILRSFRPQ